MKMTENRKDSLKWVGSTFSFAVIVVILLVLTLEQPVVGLIGTAILLLVVIVGSVLKAYFQGDRKEVDGISKEDNITVQRKNEMIEPLKKKELKNSQRLLRYATAILAFLSLTTTANGMKSFVFDSSWMAYFASFAVQSILVIFSLLLCRFFVQVMKLSWATYVKRIVSWLMIAFFCVALTVSSAFSYCYIANNAYQASWLRDSEVIIQDYLLKAAYALREENERRGKIILNSIKETANDKLIDVIRKNEENVKNSAYEELDRMLDSFYYEKLPEGQVHVDRDEWIKSKRQCEENIKTLYSIYENGEKKFEDGIKTYNTVIDKINEWKDALPDSTFRKFEVDDQISKLDGIIRNLNEAKEIIDKEFIGWPGLEQALSGDIKNYRSGFTSKVEDVIRYSEEIKSYIEKLQNNIVILDDTETVDDAEKELDNILAQIYLLGIGEEEELDELIAKINKLAVSTSGGQSLDSENIQNIVSLSNDLVMYSNYLSLKKELDNYIETDLKKTYEIVDEDSGQADEKSLNSEDENAGQLETQERKDDDAGEFAAPESFVCVVLEKEWKDERNADFYSFYTFVKSLPDVSEINADTGDYNEADAKDYNEKDYNAKDYNEKDYNEKDYNEKDDRKEYKADDELMEASVYQRDLLGELTDFEKAYNYLKYDFPVMAFFSLFIAVFFDLGAFFVGCFLYATEYFKMKKDKKEETAE